MNIDDLLEQLDEIIDSGVKIPGKRSLIDADKLREIVDDIRLNLPTEIKQAKGIVADRAEIITEAKRTADNMIHSAEERAKAMVAQEEITQLAQAKASEIISTAQVKSREIRKAAQDFVDDLMNRADAGLTANLVEVRKTKASLKQQTGTQQVK